MKAVVWTDVVQSASMFGALILVAIKGSIDLGGADIVFRNAVDTNRIEGPKYKGFLLKRSANNNFLHLVLTSIQR